MNFRDQIYPKKAILGAEFKITIVEFEISPLEYPLVLRFKAILSFGVEFAPKGILRMEFIKTIVKLEISAFERHFVPSFI